MGQFQLGVESNLGLHCFALICSVIGLENLHLSLSQSGAKLKPIMTLSLVFSCTSGWLHLFTLSSDWFLMIFTFVLIGHCDCFGFATLNLKELLV